MLLLPRTCYSWESDEVINGRAIVWDLSFTLTHIILYQLPDPSMIRMRGRIGWVPLSKAAVATACP